VEYKKEAALLYQTGGGICRDGGEGLELQQDEEGMVTDHNGKRLDFSGLLYWA
jgi:hypothetical protein